MASVRASLLTQARQAAQHLDATTTDGVPDWRTVDQLVRCARLSPDAEHTLDWALASLVAHSTDSRDRVACQLLRAARARLARAEAASGTSAPLAWH